LLLNRRTDALALIATEPTTGLDSRAAMTVVVALKHVAQLGRSIVCTIHQPPAELFFHFDTMLLLEPGGCTAYFGPIGKRGAQLTSFFASLPVLLKPMPARMNPASWAIDVVRRVCCSPIQAPFPSHLLYD
jgi:ABC-type multidrug transport system ATPase subunit